MDYEAIAQQTEIITWILLAGIGIFWLLIFAAIIALIRWLWKKGSN